MGRGFNFFLNGLNRSSTTYAAWTDVDVSGDIPSGSTGVILEIVNIGTAAVKIGGVRCNGSTVNNSANMNIIIQGHIFAVVGVDANRIFEAYLTDVNVQIWLIGYCDENCGLFVDALDRSITATGAWTDKDVSADIPADATGVIIEIISTATTSKQGAIRKNGSTDARQIYSKLRKQSHIFALCGVDASRIFEGYIEATSVKFWLYGYTKAPVTFFTNEIDKSLTGTVWTDIDVTAETEATADGIIVHMFNLDTATEHSGEIRKNGSSDDRSANSQIVYGTTGGGHIFGLCGMDSEQIFEGKIDNVAVDFYIIGYAKPSAISKLVSGIVVCSGSILRGKAFTVSGLTQALGSILRGKKLTVSGSTILSGSVSVYTGVIQKFVSGLTQGLGSILRGKKFIILGLVTCQAWVTVWKGEVFAWIKAKWEDWMR